MPFTSKRQQRAAFGGHIPGFSKKKAKEWADKTDFGDIPDRVPSEKGKPTLRTLKKRGKIKDAAAKMLARRALRHGSASGLGARALHGGDDGEGMLSAYRRDVAPITYYQSKRAMDESIIRRFVKLANMIGVTNMGGGRDAGDAGISTSKIKGRALSTAAVNPNRTLQQAMTKFSPKVR